MLYVVKKTSKETTYSIGSAINPYYEVHTKL